MSRIAPPVLAALALTWPSPQTVVADELLLQPTPLVLRDGRIAHVSVHTLAFAEGEEGLASQVAADLGGLATQVGTDCFLTAQIIGHVRPGEVEGADTLEAHRLARARADGVQSELIGHGLPAASIASVWDWQFLVQEPRATLWVFRLSEGEDCDGEPLVAGREPPADAPMAAADASDLVMAQPEAETAEEPAETAEEPDVAEAEAEIVTEAAETEAAEVEAEVSEPETVVAEAAEPEAIEAEREAPDEGEPVSDMADEADAEAEPVAETESPPVAEEAESIAEAAPEAAELPAPVEAEPEAVGAEDVTEAEVEPEIAADEAAPATMNGLAADGAVIEEDTLAAQITFPVNSSYFPSGAAGHLGELVDALDPGGRYRVEIAAGVGSGGVRGAEDVDQARAYNRWLAERRVERVQEWLEANSEAELELDTRYVENDTSRRVVLRVSPRS